MSVSIPWISGGGRKLNREKRVEWTQGWVHWQSSRENNTHWQCFRQIKKKKKKTKLPPKTINTSELKAISAFYTGRNSKVVLIPKYFILAWCTGVCLSITDAPKWPSISYYINKLNGEKCSPNRQQLVITIMLLSRHNKPWRGEKKRLGTALDYHTTVTYKFAPSVCRK